MTDDAKTSGEPEEKRTERDSSGRWTKGHSGNPASQFQVGNRANPGGRPKTKTITDAVIAHLGKKAVELDFVRKVAEKMDIDPNEATVLEVLTAAHILNAIKGKGDISREIWSRIEGHIPKHVTLGSDDPVLQYLSDMEDATSPPEPDDPLQIEGSAAEDVPTE